LHLPLKDAGFQRHVRACNNVVLPGARLPFLLDDQPVGFVPASVAAALNGLASVTSDRVVLADPAALPAVARTLADRGLFRWRGEAFDVRARPDGPVLAQIDRGAIPSFGTQAAGVHVNGLVQRADGPHLWIARRARDKLLDPGKLDHIVAGGIPAGLGRSETLIKEAAEEAAIPAELAAQAVPVGTIEYAMTRDEGLRRDMLYCYDLVLPADFIPRPADGEVEAFELWPIARAVETVRTTNDFKFNVNLVLIDLFVRLGVAA
jgi:8-oxo-dGTP pyrophosphatase MutT (NUDIX family)